MEFITLKTALADYQTNTLTRDEVNEDNILQWASDCLEKIGGYRQYTHNIATLEIKNYKAKLPRDFIAAELLMHQTSSSCKETSLALTEVVSTLDSNCKVVCSDCCNQGIVQTDAQPYLAQNYPWFGYSRVVMTSNMFDNKKLPALRPMKLNNKAAIKYHLEGFEDLIVKNDYKDYVEYTMSDGYITAAEKEGNVILFYLGQKIDDDGYPMIPNKIEYIEAIFFYIMYKMAWADYAAEKTQQARLFFMDAKRMSDDAIARCMSTPTWEEYKAMGEMWRNRIPQVNLYGNNINYDKAKRLYARH